MIRAVVPGVIRPRPYYGFRRHMSVDTVITGLTDGLQTIHQVSGLPWWAVIPLSALSLRTVWTLPLAIIQRKRLQKQAEFKSVISATNPILKLNLGKKVQAAKMKQAKELEGKSDAAKLAILQNPLPNMKYEEILLLSAKETRKRQKLLFKKHNIQLWKNFILPAFQIPLWIALSLTVRNLCGWLSWDSLANKPLDPSLYNEGILWFTDLTSYDHMHVMPMVLGIISLCNIEWTFKTLELLRLTQRNTLRPTVTDAIANVSRMSVVFMMAISLNAPVGLALYWISSQLFSLIQNIILDVVYPISYSPKKRLADSVNRNPQAKSIVNRASTAYQASE